MGVPARFQKLLRTGFRALPPELSPFYRGLFNGEPEDFIRFPCNPPRVSRLEAWAVKRRSGPMICVVCGELAQFKIDDDNLRESCRCARCGAMNRNRQIAYVLCAALSKQLSKPVFSLADVARYCKEIAIYNTEATGAMHAQLRGLPGYQSSEYFGRGHRSGDMINGVMHQDLMELSLSDNSLDIVIPSDVFEHIPDPYRAHQEVHRVLKLGGRHVFTVPFHSQGFLDETRATLDQVGNPVFLSEPIYHGDPLSLQGALVYTIFGLEMLVRLRRIGFLTNLFHLSVAWLGIIGPNALVFDAVKV